MEDGDTTSTAGGCVLCTHAHTCVPISSEERDPGSTTEAFVQKSELQREEELRRNWTRLSTRVQAVITGETKPFVVAGEPKPFKSAVLKLGSCGSQHCILSICPCSTHTKLAKVCLSSQGLQGARIEWHWFRSWLSDQFHGSPIGCRFSVKPNPSQAESLRSSSLIECVLIFEIRPRVVFSWTENLQPNYQCQMCACYQMI